MRFNHIFLFLLFQCGVLYGLYAQEVYTVTVSTGTGVGSLPDAISQVNNPSSAVRKIKFSFSSANQAVDLTQTYSIEVANKEIEIDGSYLTSTGQTSKVKVVFSVYRYLILETAMSYHIHDIEFVGSQQAFIESQISSNSNSITDGQFSNYVLSIESSNTTVERCVFRKGGIVHKHALPSNNDILSNLKINNNYFGISPATSPPNPHPSGITLYGNVRGLEIKNNHITSHIVINNQFFNTNPLSTTPTDITIEGNYVGVDHYGNCYSQAWDSETNKVSTIQGVYLSGIKGTTISRCKVVNNVVAGFPNYKYNELPIGVVTGDGITYQNGDKRTVGTGMMFNACQYIDIENNKVGTNGSGTSAANTPNGSHGIYIENSNHLTVGGDQSSKGNVIGNNDASGVHVYHSDDITLSYNKIGVDINGTTAVSNALSGVYALGCVNLTLSNNILSGNGTKRSTSKNAPQLPGPFTDLFLYDFYAGVSLFNCQNAQVEFNKIGVDQSGTKSLGNGMNGLIATNYQYTFPRTPSITSSVTVKNNQISGNTGVGIAVHSVATTIQNNLIGTDATGSIALPNTLGGIHSISSTIDINSNTISGNGTDNPYQVNMSGDWGIADPADKNAIYSGISIYGGEVSSVVTAKISNNVIGLSKNTMYPLANTGTGISLFNITSSRYEVSGNTIGSNGKEGIFVETSGMLDGANVSTITNNYIGTNASGMDLGNNRAGVFVKSYGFNSTPLNIESNTIAYNNTKGVMLATVKSIKISKNKIYGNKSASEPSGIDLAPGANYDISAPEMLATGFALLDPQGTAPRYQVKVKVTKAPGEVIPASGRTIEVFQSLSHTAGNAHIHIPTESISYDGNADEGIYTCLIDPQYIVEPDQGLSLLSTCTGTTATDVNTSEFSDVRSYLPPKEGSLDASFTYRGNCTDTKVNFYATASLSPQIVTYSWNFGDQSTSNQRNPVHEYASQGRYLVTLTLTHGNAQVIKQLEVVVGKAVATFETPSGCIGVPYSFKSAGGGHSYHWTFGDGSTSSSSNPEHSYTSSGTYTVTLKVSNSSSQPAHAEPAGECVSAYTAQLVIHNGVSISSINIPSQVCQGVETPFTATVSGGTPSYHWTFGDANPQGTLFTSTRSSTTHTYAGAGEFPLTLEVSNGQCKTVETRVVRVSPVPVLILTAEKPFICVGGNEGTPLTATHSGYMLISSYQWQYRPTSNEAWQPLGVGGNQYSASQAGQYQVRASNECGLGSYATTTLGTRTLSAATITNITGVSCAKRADGGATITLTPTPSPAYTYVWSSGETGAQATALGEGLNAVTISDGSCSKSYSVLIPYTGPVLTGITKVDASCAPNSTGSISLEVAGGISTTYVWKSGNTTLSGNGSTLSNLAPGSYEAVITSSPQNANKICVLHTGTINLSTPIVETWVSNTGSCGTSAVEVVSTSKLRSSQGDQVGNYSYQWAAKTGTNTWTTLSGSGPSLSLTPGYYRLTVTDAGSQCSQALPFTVSEQEALSVTLQAIHPTCPGSTDGALLALVPSVSSNVSYAWTKNNTLIPSYTSHSLLNQGLGQDATASYSVTVTDERGCTATASATLTNPTGHTVTWLTSPVPTTCHAQVTLSPSTTSPTTYRWIRKFTQPETQVDPQNSNQTITVNNTVTNTEEVTQDNQVSGLKAGNYYVEAEVGGCVYTSGEQSVIKTSRATMLRARFVFENVAPQIISTQDPDPDNIVAELDDIKSAFYDAMDACVASKEKEFKEVLEEGAACTNLSLYNDKLQVIVPVDYYQYTLYYYDRAGNLTSTVPPEGVHLLDVNDANAVLAFRNGLPNAAIPSPSIPAHSMITRYEYNSLGQLVSQATPDAGTTRFIYTDKSLLRFSQNARQAADNPQRFSYTKYDHLQRIVEVGEATLPSGQNDFITALTTTDKLEGNAEHPHAAYPSQGTDVTITSYSSPHPDAGFNGTAPTYLTNRVAYSLRDTDGNLSTTHDQSRTDYSYDVHGNVVWLSQILPGSQAHHMAYEYDLVSGSMLKVSYNPHQPDRFFHKYEYDAQKRLKHVYTSTDNHLWNREASYTYYAHGPVKSIELGQDKIQKTDFAYTIQGWLKAINSRSASQEDNAGHLNDAYQMALGYFTGDFVHTGSSLEGVTTPAGITNPEAELYNGNIRTWVSEQMVSDANGGTKNSTTVQHFKYDDLNRILISSWKELGQGRTFSTEFTGTTAAVASNNNAFSTAYTYDANGNIQTLKRNTPVGTPDGIPDGTALMDDLDYDYGSGDNKNKLLRVEDKTINTTVDGTLGDIYGKDTEKHQYTYDAIGNLIAETYVEKKYNTSSEAYDKYNVASTISWDVYGKVSKVTIARTLQGQATTTTSELRFGYSSDGQRIYKEVVEDNTKTGDALEAATKRTWYVRDFDGNVMANYERSNTVANNTLNATFTLTEQPIYGSSRLGMRTPNKEVFNVTYNHASANKPTLVVADASITTSNTLHNWVSTATQTIENSGGCNCQVRSFNFPGPDNAPAPTPVEGILKEFMGTPGTQVSTTENQTGEVQFYTVSMRSYLGVPNVLLILDKEGNLMKGSQNIVADPESQAIAVQRPGTNTYYLVSNSPTGQPQYHQIDMSATGFDSRKGEVISKNTPLDSRNIRYGRHMAGVEDNKTNTSIVYLSRHADGKVELVAMKLGKDGKPTLNNVVYSIASPDPVGQGEMILSPSGKHLAWYRHGRKVLGFQYREVEVDILTLSESRTSVSSIHTIKGHSQGNLGKGSLSYDAQGKVYFTQEGMFQTNPSMLYKQDDTNGSLPQGNYTAGDIRQARNSKLYTGNRSNSGLWDQTVGQGVVTASSYYSNTGSLPQAVYRIKVAEPTGYSRVAGERVYELNDHLGNVHVVLSDMRAFISISNDVITNAPQYHSTADYLPFGMAMPGRGYQSKEYRYGFQGQETEQELSDGDASFFKYRISDNRIGRFFAVDPLTADYPWNSPYAFSENIVIDAIELEGLEKLSINRENGEVVTYEGKQATYEYETSVYNSMMAAGQDVSGFPTTIGSNDNMTLNQKGNYIDGNIKFTIVSLTYLSLTEKVGELLNAADTWLIRHRYWAETKLVIGGMGAEYAYKQGNLGQIKLDYQLYDNKSEVRNTVKVSGYLQLSTSQLRDGSFKVFNSPKLTKINKDFIMENSTPFFYVFVSETPNRNTQFPSFKVEHNTTWQFFWIKYSHDHSEGTYKVGLTLNSKIDYQESGRLKTGLSLDFKLFNLP